MTEIIDLTVSPTRPEIIEISSDQEPTPRRPNRTQENKTRRKRRTGKVFNGLASDGLDSSSQPSRAHSPENGNRPSSELNESTPPRSSPLWTSSIIDEPGLFIFDGAPAPIAVEDSPPASEPVESGNDGNKLLLPSHVSFFHEDGPTLTEVLPPPKLSSGDEEYIEYLDYEDRKAPGLVRYFEAEGEEFNQSKPSIFKCKKCGAEGDHKASECPIQICLTCGVRDEHPTRSCPIGKTCYTCGMKGHINKTCPNRFSARMTSSDFHGDCERCGSADHRMNECPTLWRIYQYVNDEERIVIMQSREEKEQLAIGEGGEGYISGELWCYNCANSGHLGDDCNELPHPPTSLPEYSAFSSHNIMSGPFYDPAAELFSIKRVPRERGSKADWDTSPPVDVGKRAKTKDKEKLEKRFREQEEEGDDWFNDMRNVKRRGMDQQAAPPPSSRGKFRFGSFKGGGLEPPSSSPSLPTSSSGSSLLARIGDARGGKGRGKSDRGRDGQRISQQSENSIRIRGAASDPRNQDGKYANSRKAEREGGQDRWDRDRPGQRGSRRGHGPRYKGGYDR